MKIGSTARKFILSSFTFAIIISTSLAFHATQSFYKYFAQGKRYFNAKRFADALPFFVSARGIEPHNLDAAFFLLWTYEKMDKKNQAKKVLDYIWSTNPQDPEVTRQLGDAYYGLSDYAKAEVFYLKALAQKPGSKTRIKLAEVLAWQRKYDESILILDGLLSERPRDLELIEFTADVSAWAKKYDRAVELYEKLLSYGYHAEDISLKMADALRYAGRDEEAIKLYEKFLKKK